MEELLSLKWNNHRSTFIHILGVLRDKQLYTDAVLACDGKFYNVHKLVMSTCSDYFSAIFDKTNCKNPVIVLKDIKSEDLEALLDYMYLGEVNVRQSDLASLIKSAECLRIKGLAVPDDEPPPPPPRKPTVNKDIKRDIIGSPPSKRRRRDESEDGRDDVRPSHVYRRSSSPLPKSPPPPPACIINSQPNNNSSTINEPSPLKYKEQPPDPDPIPVKQEQEDPIDDDIQEAETFDLTNDDFKEENNDDDLGADDLSNDLPKFLQGDHSGFPPDAFAGPSAYQPGDLAGWHGDNSNLGFPSQLNFSSDSSSQQNAPGVRTLAEQVQAHHFSGFTSNFAAYSDKTQKTFPCTLCGRKFKWRWCLARHMKSHTGEKPFGCPQCPYRASRKDQVKNHILGKHEVPNPSKALENMFSFDAGQLD